MTPIMKVEMVSSEESPGFGFLIEKMIVDPGDMVGMIVEERRLRWSLIDYLDGSKVPRKGTVEYYDKKGKRASIRIASVTENRCYLGDMTVSEYLDHFRTISGLTVDPKKKEEIISSLKLSHVADCRIYTLPLDGQKFIEVARALYADPDLLIIDMASFPIGLDTDKVFTQIIKEWSCKGRRACIIISDMAIVQNPIYERIFFHQFGRIVEDTDRTRSIRTLEWAKYNVGVENVSEAIKALEGLENVEVNGSRGTTILISINEGMHISDVNKELVNQGIGVISINPANIIAGGVNQ